MTGIRFHEDAKNGAIRNKMDMTTLGTAPLYTYLYSHLIEKYLHSSHIDNIIKYDIVPKLWCLRKSANMDAGAFSRFGLELV